MSKHAPGPWYAVGTWVEHPDDDVPDICVCDPFYMGQKHVSPDDLAQAEANARLIAAAPDMLLAIQNIIRYGYDGDDDLYRLKQIVVNATNCMFSDLREDEDV